MDLKLMIGNASIVKRFFLSIRDGQVFELGLREALRGDPPRSKQEHYSVPYPESRDALSQRAAV